MKDDLRAVIVEKIEREIQGFWADICVGKAHQRRINTSLS